MHATVRKTKMRDLCRPFYLHLHGNQREKGLTLSTGIPRSMRGNWDVALTSVSYTHTDKIDLTGETIQMLILSPADQYEAYTTVLSSMKHNAAFVRAYEPTYFKYFPHACLCYMLKNGVPASRPHGTFTLDEYITLLNNEMKDTSFYAHPGLSIFKKGNQCGVAWNYQKNHYYNVFCFPIFSETIRRMIGMPDLESHSFKKMINSLANNSNVILPESCFPFKRTPLYIECNLCEHNGIAGPGHKCSTDTEGHNLRLVSQNPDKEYNVPQHMEFRYPQYVPIQVNTFTEIRVRIVAADSRKPIVCDGMINLVLHLRPRDSDCSVDDREIHPLTRGLTTSPEETAINLSSQWTDPYKEDVDVGTIRGDGLPKPQ